MLVCMCVDLCVPMHVFESGRERESDRKVERRETKGKGESETTLSLCNLAIYVQG